MQLEIFAIYECWIRNGRIPDETFSSERDAWLYDSKVINLWLEQMANKQPPKGPYLFSFLVKYKNGKKT